MKFYYWTSVCCLFLATESVFATHSLQETNSDSKKYSTWVHSEPSEHTVLKTPEQMAADLGWLPYSDQNFHACPGSFKRNPRIDNETQMHPILESETHIHANQATSNLHQNTVLIGNISLSQPGREINADKAIIKMDEKTNSPVLADLYGHVRYQEPGYLFLGESGQIYLTKQQGHLNEMSFRVLQSQVGSLSLPKDLGIWGNADVMEQPEAKIHQLYNTSFTTCSPDNQSWHVIAERLNLNQNTGRGVARNMSLYWYQIPVFYSPYLNFPIDNRRLTGLLLPTIGGSSKKGFELDLPIYFNLAPNYDWTLTLGIFTKRGMYFQNQFRYLEDASKGEIGLAFLPHDRLFADFKKTATHTYASSPFVNQLEHNPLLRSSFYLKHHTDFAANLDLDIDYNWMSDPYQFEDFGTQMLPNTRQLPQQIALHYQLENVQLNALLQNYQTLQPVDLGANYYPYSRLPEINFGANFSPSEHVEWGVKNNDVYFSRSHWQPNELTAPINGMRTYLEPSLRFPFRFAGGEIIPEIDLSLSHYALEHQLSGKQNSISRLLPIISVDSSLFLKRFQEIGSSSYVHTLEPRIQYVYIPYRNQDDIPVFDSNITNYQFQQLFEHNRYSGYDRLGDMNDINIGVTTRLLNAEDGSEKIHASLGGKIFLKKYRVTTCTIPGCQTNADSSIVYPPSLSFELAYHYSDEWQTLSSLNYDSHTKKFQNKSVYLNYFANKNQLFNIGYFFTKDGDTQGWLSSTPTTNLNQLAFSFVWQIQPRWLLLASMRHNLSQSYLQNQLYGLEYNSCCWAARFFIGRNFNAFDNNNRPLFSKIWYLQLKLKGLGAFGKSNPDKTLADLIPNFKGDFFSE